MFRLLLFVCLTHLVVGRTISGRVLLNGNSTRTTSLPKDCQLLIQLSNVGIADGAAPVLASVQYPNVASFPISYRLTFPSVTTVPSNFLALSAHITCSNGDRYMNDYRVTVPDEDDADSIVNINVLNIHKTT
ncbi:hypothetical protein I4U23_001397 [Adineta vaga]|nr:hypothetical protein I4U23_001397 [Adineta vaga]